MFATEKAYCVPYMGVQKPLMIAGFCTIIKGFCTSIYGTQYVDKHVHSCTLYYVRIIHACMYVCMYVWPKLFIASRKAYSGFCTPIYGRLSPGCDNLVKMPQQLGDNLVTTLLAD